MFGEDRWNTVIDSIVQRGMVWDVADEFNQDPPAGTPFYIFSSHGRHNQHFVYKNGMIYAQQNRHVVTYVGGEEPFIMMPPSKTNIQNSTHLNSKIFKRIFGIIDIDIDKQATFWKSSLFLFNRFF